MKKLIPVCLLALLLSLTLVACGEKPTVPTYSGGTSVTVPDSVSNNFKSSLQNVKNANVTAYKTSDDLGKVKSGLQDGFKSGGWDDKASELGNADSIKQIEGVGGFILGYQKSDTAAVVIGLPSSLAGNIGLTGLGASDNVYMVFTGDK